MTGETYDKDVKISNTFMDKPVSVTKEWADHINDLVEGTEIDINSPLEEEE